MRTDKEILEPNEATKDKVLFILNNLSQDNVSAKAVDMKSVLTESIYHWFTNYLVVKRVCTEPNYHSLYIALLDLLQVASVDRAVLEETYANVKILLDSDKTVKNVQERTLLKNLGSWLGAITLAKNKAIMHDNLSLKNLLIDGHKTNRLIVTIPFVCKVLEQCKTSLIYHPPNPWLMSILRLLVELYQNADLKLNLKFEIEVMCKTIDVELKDIQATTVIFNKPVQPKPVQYNPNVAEFNSLSLQDGNAASVSDMQ